MNNQEKYKEDPLRQYINPERIEKAPEGFTSTVMTRIRLKTEPLEVKEKRRISNIVPFISVTFTLILIVIASVLPSGNNDSVILPGLKLIQNFDFSALKINLETLFSFSLPGWLPYLFISIFILTILDRALFGLFHRD